MEVYKMVKMAKTGDKEARIWLDMHYEPIMKKNIEKKYGIEAAEEFVELLPNLIDYYFDNKLKDRLDTFLSQKAETLYEPKQKRILIGSKAPKDEEMIDYVANHYSEYLYVELIRLTTNLSKKELKKYSFLLMKDICKKEGKTDIRNKMMQYILREVERYKENEELLLQKYIIYIGLTDKIFDYFYEKYEYIKDLQKKQGQRILIEESYSKVIKNVLINLKKPCKNMEELFSGEFVALCKNNNSNFDKAVLEYRENNAKDIDVIYNSYLHIKEFTFNKYQGKVVFSDEELRKQIDEKYTDYINAYVNGISKTNIHRYLYTRLADYFKRYLLTNKKVKKEKVVKKPPITEEEARIAKEKFDELRYFIDRYLDKIEDKSKLEEVKKQLEEAYDNLYVFYCKKTRKTPIEHLIRYTLKESVDEINNKTYKDADSYEKEAIITKGEI